jgi:hypothetical protein
MHTYIHAYIHTYHTTHTHTHTQRPRTNAYSRTAVALINTSKYVAIKPPVRMFIVVSTGRAGGTGVLVRAGDPHHPRCGLTDGVLTGAAGGGTRRVTAGDAATDSSNANAWVCAA